MHQVSMSTRRSMLELAAVVLTGALHLFFEEVLHRKTAFIVLALIGWGAYLLLTVVQKPGVLREWGLRHDSLGRDSRVPVAVLLAGAAALAAAGAARGTLLVSWHMLPLFALYPIWGLVQQFMVQAMVARNLHRVVTSHAIVTVTAAILFGVVHWPDHFLMTATFTLGILFTPIYLQRRSLLPLGFCHGVLGVLAYYWLLGRDPWLALFG